MIAPEAYHNVRTWLAGCRQPLLLTHRRPDGDALGAMAAMTYALRALDLDPRPALYEPLPSRYALLARDICWQLWASERARLVAECDAVVVLDTCAWSQLEPVADYLRTAPRTLVIDHHPTRDVLGQRAGDLLLCDESAGAVCLLVAEWMETVGLPIEPPTARALLTGLATDCGWFRFANTDARLLNMAARLAVAVPSINDIYRAIYEQDSPGKLRLIGRMLLSLELLANDKLAVLKLRQSDFAAAGADGTMTEDIVNEAGRLNGIEATVLFTEEPDGSVRVNFRSKQTLDVAALAAQFGGGGHQRAAGARPHGSWDEVVARVTAATAAALRT